MSPVSKWRKIHTWNLRIYKCSMWSDHSNENYNADWWYLWSDNLTILSHLSWSGLVRSGCLGHSRGSQQVHIFINWQLCHLEPWPISLVSIRLNKTMIWFICFISDIKKEDALFYNFTDKAKMDCGLDIKTSQDEFYYDRCW